MDYYSLGNVQKSWCEGLFYRQNDKDLLVREKKTGGYHNCVCQGIIFCEKTEGKKRNSFSLNVVHGKR